MYGTSLTGGTRDPLRFSSEDDVLLVVLTNAYHSSSDFETQTRSYAVELGKDVAVLPRVHFSPRLQSTEMPSLYAAADVFVLPSRGEGWGRPHVEAMAMGLPVVATNWSGVTEYLTEETG